MKNSFSKSKRERDRGRKGGRKEGKKGGRMEGEKEERKEGGKEGRHKGRGGPCKKGCESQRKGWRCYGMLFQARQGITLLDSLKLL